MKTLTAADSGPLAAYVWKTTADPFVGKITYFRVYSGMLSVGDTRVWNQNKCAEERIGTLHLLRGKEQIAVKTVHCRRYRHGFQAERDLYRRYTVRSSATR